ncbi:MAG: hypothetical protein EZS28_013939 [Streblomastix strix]|uniref:Uncharacterized protein n=1 Tax=Streblomastix strix TaxID=222440 RepID=A0A5J4W6I5_9EUKA|nr:MAG: hypothetical protein EZS28_013939 [Streblomastix strix]
MLQWSLFQPQRNAVLSIDGFQNLFQMPLAGDHRDQEAIMFENLRLRRRYFDPELGSHNIANRNQASIKDSTGGQLDDRNGRALDHSRVDGRVFVLAVEYKCNNDAYVNILKEENIEVTKTFDGTSQVKDSHKNKRLDIGNWRDPMHKSTTQTRIALHQVTLEAERQGSSRYLLINRYTSRDQTGEQQFRQAHPVQDDGITNQKESEEGFRSWRME